MIDIPKITLKKGSAEEKPVIDFKLIHDAHFINIEEVLKPQPVAISIGESQYKGNYYPVSYGSYGDFSCIVGASKSKKTFLKSMITAGYIGGNSNQFAEQIKGHNTGGKFIIDFDTEQSEYHSQRVFRRVIEMVGCNTEMYRPFSLRKLSANERLDFINWIFTESQYAGKIGLALIDGVADLLNDVNDLEASNMIAQKLLSWSAGTELLQPCHIITVLHKNFGSAKPTGHLGSAVLKKAESVIFVEKLDSGEIKVSPEYTRNIPFDEFVFDVNNEWLPYVVPFDSIKQVDTKNNKNANF